jgi:O-antigen/teichoic acid export membrane protein
VRRARAVMRASSARSWLRAGESGRARAAEVGSPRSQHTVTGASTLLVASVPSWMRSKLIGARRRLPGGGGVSRNLPGGMRHGFGWSMAYTVTTRAVSLVSVPLVLHALGADLYAVWVLAGSLVMIQSLFDFGAASALVRFVAVAHAQESRRTVYVLVRRGLIFYIGLSAALGVPAWLLGGSLLHIVHFLSPKEHAAAVTILHWSLIAFAITNVTLVLASLLQGINQVGTSYRDQTIGWLAYLPLLILALSTMSAADAVGLAWVGAFTLQAVLLARSCLANLRMNDERRGPAPKIREMLTFGGRWQVSAWADFATFQLPRFVASAALPAAGLLSLDLAIRAGQLATAPFLAFYPTVLPRAAALLATGQGEALRSFLIRYYRLIAGASLVVLAVCVPLAAPALATWTSRPVKPSDVLVAALIIAGTVGHASTGLLTSAQLARGNARSVMRYKTAQLALAVVLLPLASSLSVIAVAVALSVSLSLPALVFNRRTANEFGIKLRMNRDVPLHVAVLVGIFQFVGPMLLVIFLAPKLPAWVSLALAAVVVSACAACSWSLLRPYRRALSD